MIGAETLGCFAASLRWARMQDAIDCERLGARLCFVRHAEPEERPPIIVDPGCVAVAIICRPLNMRGLTFARCYANWPEGAPLPTAEPDILALLPTPAQPMFGGRAHAEC